MLDNKVLVKWSQDYGRMGDLDALFVTTKREYLDMVGSSAYLGEALGKHSEVEADLCAQNLRILTEDQDFISKLQTYVCSEHYPEYVSGADLLSRWREQAEEDNLDWDGLVDNYGD